VRCLYCGGELLTGGCPRCDSAVTYTSETVVVGYLDGAAGRLPVIATVWKRVRSSRPGGSP